jgi:hypothetical protein
MDVRYGPYTTVLGEATLEIRITVSIDLCKHTFTRGDSICQPCI